MADAVRVVVAGAGGRMGRALIEAVLHDPRLALSAALDIPGSEALGHDAGTQCAKTTGVVVGSDLDAALAVSDVLVDFTRPAGTLMHVAGCVRHGVAAVVGTTGLDAAERATLAQAAQRIPIVFAANMSVGVNVLLSLVEDAARALGPGYDIEIVEMHHRHKVDAPSGTALRLGEAAAVGAGRALADSAVYARDGGTGERRAGTIGFASLRGGDVVGEHMVVFAGDGERVEIVHRATSRHLFAAGALRAVEFVAGARREGRAGIFDMSDVLGLHTRSASPATH
ncbi:MAG: 4-hydroxy-tetrahydrodipicolinate reductase [Burkholderiales bacterium]|nr:4-hydroxy-tetrahydrodipicolinate reductase [Burkholderiales bacterium]